jgi:hypothetical protein
MRRVATALSMLCAVLLGAACENVTNAAPTAPPTAPSPPVPPRVLSSWMVTSTLASFTGEACALRDEGVTWSRRESVGEGLELRVEQTGTTIRLREEWGSFGIEYEGEMVDRNFTAIAPSGPPLVFRCSDGTTFDAVLCQYDVGGHFSDDERELTARRRYMCWRVGDGLVVLTVAWAWTATRV